MLETKPNSFYSFLTSNPAPVVDDDGSVYLIFKSRRYEGNVHGKMNIGIATAPHFSGPYKVVNEAPLFSEDNLGVIEDPFLWKNADGFHLLAKDHEGSITGTIGEGFLAHSPDCLKWRVDAEPQAYSRDVQWDDGTSQRLGNMERCSALLNQNGDPTHLFFAIWEGEGGFSKPMENDTSRSICVPLK